ncbi:MAG: PH domain-containing protein [Armatimonadetes bacterium]|nr:PH domain-containing protein [Armatimonadota bacterium]
MFDQPRRLHYAAVIIKFGSYFVSTIKSLAAPIVAIFVSGRHSSETDLALKVAITVAAVGAISIISTVMHYFSTTFFIENEALVISTGFIWRKRRTIPLARIQNVNIERTIWHRFLGAAAIKVETAAGAKAEGELSALSVEDANSLQSALLKRSGGHPAEEESAAAKAETLYELSPRQVLLAGALGNRAAYVIGSIVAVFQFEGSGKIISPFFHWLSRQNPVMGALLGALTFVGLFVIGWILSIVISATRYYGFRIEKHERGLLLTHGLITQFRNIVPVGRIQVVRVVEPMLYRLFGYCELYADTAGSFDTKDVASANKICPIIPENGAASIGKLLLPEFEFEALRWRRISPKSIARFAWQHFITWVIMLSLPFGYWLHWNALWLTPFLAIWCIVAAIINYRYVGYSWTNDILAARRGVLRKQATIIPFDRIQHYSIRATWFQRMRGLASVTAVSAAMGGHSVHVADVDAKDAEEMRQTIGAAIRTHLGSRRGGL